MSYIRGMQSTGTVACIKHLAANNQETGRFNVNAQVSERALREIHWPAFEMGASRPISGALFAVFKRENGFRSDTV